MTDTYRTAVNPYTAKAAEARAKLERQRVEAAEVERQRDDMLREINEAIAPLRVHRERGHPEVSRVRLTHAQADSSLVLCFEVEMLARLPSIISSTFFAECAENLAVEAARKQQRIARRESLGLATVDQPSLLARLTWPVSATAASAAISCAIMGDLDPWRIVTFIVIGLPINFWWFGTFKRSTP